MIVLFSQQATKSCLVPTSIPGYNSSTHPSYQMRFGVQRDAPKAACPLAVVLRRPPATSSKIPRLELSLRQVETLKTSPNPEATGVLVSRLPTQDILQLPVKNSPEGAFFAASFQNKMTD